MNVHFIAIGGTVMHNLAVALHQKGDRVTGSDAEIYEPSRSRLEENGLLPEKEGWDPGRIHPALDAVILGMNIRKNNPELKRARELGIRVLSFPEYLFEHSFNKKRIVIGGTHGKTTITAMVMHVLHALGKDFDYLVSSGIRGFDGMVRLSEDAPCILLEGDEYLSSPIDEIPKFHRYHPHMILLSGIAWDHMNLFRTFDNYKKQFHRFLQIATGGGKVFYFDGDPVLGEVVDSSHWSLMKIPYGEHPYRVEKERFLLQTKYGEIPVRVIGRHNMQNISGAMQICRELGVEDHLFYESIQSFRGVERRQQLLASGKGKNIFIDYARAPSSVEATIHAFRETYPGHKLLVCLELHTFSSLNPEYLPLYKGKLQEADRALVYFNPEVVRRRKLPDLTPESVRDYFGMKDLGVYTDSGQLEEDLRNLDEDTCVLLFMATKSFSGLDLKRLACELAGQPMDTKK